MRDFRDQKAACPLKKSNEPPASASRIAVLQWPHKRAKIRLKYTNILPSCEEAPTNSKKLRIGKFFRTSLTGLSALLRNAMFIFPPMNPVGSSLSLGRRHGLRVRPRSPFRPILCNSAPFLEVGRRPTGSLRGVTSENSPILAIA